MDIIYRSLQKADFPAVKGLIDQSFGLHHYVGNQGVLDSWLDTYLQSCLAEATYTCVAEKDGAPIGVIMGKANKDYRAILHVKPLLAFGYHSLCMSIKALFARCDNGEYRLMHQTYGELRAACSRKFDGALTLFAIAEDCRGLGVGKKLLRRLLSYQKRHGVKNGYLYTDTTCNVGFYEHQGFERLGEKELQVTRDGKKMKLGVYLYGYKV